MTATATAGARSEKQKFHSCQPQLFQQQLRRSGVKIPPWREQCPADRSGGSLAVSDRVRVFGAPPHCAPLIPHSSGGRTPISAPALLPAGANELWQHSGVLPALKSSQKPGLTLPLPEQRCCQGRVTQGSARSFCGTSRFLGIAFRENHFQRGKGV